MAKVTSWFDKLKGAGFSYLPATETWRDPRTGCTITTDTLEGAMGSGSGPVIPRNQQTASPDEIERQKILAQYQLASQQHYAQAIQTTAAQITSTVYTGPVTAGTGMLTGYVQGGVTSGAVFGQTTFGIGTGQVVFTPGQVVTGTYLADAVYAPTEPHSLLDPVIDLDDIHAGQAVLEELGGQTT